MSDVSAEATGLSFGRRLASAREALSLSVNDMAARLRISPKQVSALEREDLAALPGPVFVRGFVRNYAKEVRVDPAPLLEALNRLLEPAAEAQPPQPSAPLMRTAERERASRTLVIASAIGALIVFAALGWIANTRSRQAAAPASPVKAEPAGVAAPAAPSLSEAATTAVVAAPAQPDMTPSAAAPPAAPSEPGTLRFGFRAVSWVEVIQQDGTVLLSQNHPAGSEQVVRGRPPYQIVIGNASEVALEYGGKPIDLKPVTSSGNVARLTLP